MKTAELLEIRYNKTEKKIQWHRAGPDGKLVHVPGGFEVDAKAYSDPVFSPRQNTDPKSKNYGKLSRGGKAGEGHVFGTVGDWLTQMGATKSDVPAAYEKVKSSSEYRALLDIGFEDISSKVDRTNGTLTLQNTLEPLIGSEGKAETFRRKVLANGNIRAFASYGGDVNTYHGWRPATLHPFTVKTDPHSTPVERIVKSMRQSLEQLHKHYAASSKRHFVNSVKSQAR